MGKVSLSHPKSRQTRALPLAGAKPCGRVRGLAHGEGAISLIFIIPRREPAPHLSKGWYTSKEPNKFYQTRAPLFPREGVGANA